MGTSIIDNVTHDAFIIIVEFWLYIHTESFTNNDDVIFKKRVHFKSLWGSMLIFREDGENIIEVTERSRHNHPKLKDM